MKNDSENINMSTQEGASTKPIAVGLAVAVFCVLLAVAIFIGYAFDLPFSMIDRENILKWLRELVESARDAGFFGIVAIIIFYAIGVVFAAPSALMTYAVTLVYGLWAIPVAFCGAFLGLIIAFLFARFALGNQISWFCAHYPVTRSIERALRKSGFWIIFLMRQSPIIPFSAQNYMFGVLGMNVKTYALASAVGIIPGTIAKVYIFDAANKAALDPANTTSTYVFAAIGILATILVMWLIGRAVAFELKAVRHSA